MSKDPRKRRPTRPANSGSAGRSSAGRPSGQGSKRGGQARRATTGRKPARNATGNPERTPKPRAARGQNAGRDSQRPSKARGTGRKPANASGAQGRRGGKSRGPMQGRPRKPRGSEPMPRWVQILLIVVLVIAVLSAAGFFLYHNAMRGIEEKRQTEQKVQARDQAPPIAECVPDNLKVEIGDHSSQAVEGDGWSTPIKLTNMGKEPCLTDGAQKSLGLHVRSGNYDLVDTTKCGDPDYNLPLLLGPGKSWETTLSWDGRDYQKCEAGDFAAPGTYVIEINFQGKKKGEAVVNLVAPSTGD